MNDKLEVHTFHIPVMGIGFTIDTAVKVAPYGISSVISLVDDLLMEKMREFYCKKLNVPFIAIKDDNDDYRAKRITAYLNLIDQVVTEKVDELKKPTGNQNQLQSYLEFLPDTSPVKQKFYRIRMDQNMDDALNWLRKNIHTGSIDVNIMTKLDKENYHKNEKLPVEFNDAHAALRGFANSNLHSSLVLSAGMSPRLYSYIENFADFYPDADGNLRKKIILKVSDYRSAQIQGRFLAKKGLWVSEYRIESGLNCGGHAFATQGYLMGPILDEFQVHRDELIQTSYDIFARSLMEKNRFLPPVPPEMKITAQGGVGTSQEHRFLLDYYNLDSIGWGSPFLLVPEVVNIEPYTLDLLAKSKEEDLYLSNISPLGVLFNSVRENTKDIEKYNSLQQGKPGSICTKKFLISNTEFTDRPICTASRQYQKLKIAQLAEKQLAVNEYINEYNAIVEKSCICVGLGTSALLSNHLDHQLEGKGVSVCPGPNLAYFSKVSTLREMVGHIYGQKNIISRTDRPHVFIKELYLYVDFLKKKLEEISRSMTDKQIEYYKNFRDNLLNGIDYYKKLFITLSTENTGINGTFLQSLDKIEKELNVLLIGKFYHILM